MDIAGMKLSPNGKTAASGSIDGSVRLWDVETGGIISKWKEHTRSVQSVCWSADGKRVVSGSYDGTARVWDVESGKSILIINTGHQFVHVVIYSHDSTQIATGGFSEDSVKIWDAKTGKLLSTLHHDQPVFSLAWTADGKRLITGSHGPIRIFNTTTWQPTILEGHQDIVRATSLFRNDRLLASASYDNTACLWNLDTNLPVGPPLQHEGDVNCAAFSADGKLLVTGCDDTNVYVWDIHTILKEAGLEGLLSVAEVPAEKSLMDADATQYEYDEMPERFFDDRRDNVRPSANATHGVRRRHRAFAPSARSLLSRLSSLVRHSHSNTGEAAELQQRPTRTSRPRTVEVAATPDSEPLFVAAGRAYMRGRRQEIHLEVPGQASSQSQRAAPSTPLTTAPNTGTTTPGAASARPPHRPLWARIVLFLCCAPPDGL